MNLCGEDYRCPREKTIELNSPLCDDSNTCSPPDTCLFSFYQAYLPMAKQVDPLGSPIRYLTHLNITAQSKKRSCGAALASLASGVLTFFAACNFQQLSAAKGVRLGSETVVRPDAGHPAGGGQTLGAPLQTPTCVAALRRRC